MYMGDILVSADGEVFEYPFTQLACAFGGIAMKRAVHLDKPKESNGEDDPLVGEDGTSLLRLLADRLSHLRLLPGLLIEM